MNAKHPNVRPERLNLYISSPEAQVHLKAISEQEEHDCRQKTTARLISSRLRDRFSPLWLDVDSIIWKIEARAAGLFIADGTLVQAPGVL